MSKRYIKITFQNSPSTATPLNATNLNKISDALDACDTEIENKQSIANMVQSDAINDTTKYPSTAVTYAHGQAINTLIDNLAPERIAFTPTVSGLTTSGVATYVNQVGYYSKAGKIVNFYIRVKWTGHTGTGGTLIGSLPVAAFGNDIPVLTFATGITIAAGVELQALIYGNTVRLYLIQSGAASYFQIPASADIYISGSYMTT
jgi:hypothetical protein